MKIAVIDFETANKLNNSACSLGICIVDGLDIVDRKYYLIKPPNSAFSKINIEIHGITPDDVADAPTFDFIWPEISHYFNGDYIVAAHNARFDMSVLFGCLEHYDLPMPEFEYADGLSICAPLCSGRESRSLKALAAKLGIDNSRHHDALNDAVVCAKIIIASLRAEIENSIASKAKSFSGLTINRSASIGKPSIRSNYRDNIHYSLLVPSSNADTAGILFGKNVVITGEFSFATRSELISKLLELGANPKSSVSRATDYLFLGTQNPDIVGEGCKSSKEKKADELIAQGYGVKIIREEEINDFLESALINTTMQR